MLLDYLKEQGHCSWKESTLCGSLDLNMLISAATSFYSWFPEVESHRH